MNDKKTKLVFNSGVARQLVRDYECTICDLKPNRDNHEKTVFVFKKDAKFDSAMAEITKAIKEKHEGEDE